MELVKNFRKENCFVENFVSYTYGFQKSVRIGIDNNEGLWEIWFVARDIFAGCGEKNTDYIKKLLSIHQINPTNYKIGELVINGKFLKGYIVNVNGVNEIIEKTDESGIKREFREWFKWLVRKIKTDIKKGLYQRNNQPKENTNTVVDNDKKEIQETPNKNIKYFVVTKDNNKLYTFIKENKELRVAVTPDKKIWFMVSSILNCVGIYPLKNMMRTLKKSGVKHSDIDEILMITNGGNPSLVVNSKGLVQLLKGYPYNKKNLIRYQKIQERVKDFVEWIFNELIPEIENLKNIKNTLNTENIEPEKNNQQKIITINTKEPNKLPNNSQKTDNVEIQKNNSTIYKSENNKMYQNKYETIKKVESIINSFYNFIFSMKNSQNREDKIVLTEKKENFKNVLDNLKDIQRYLFDKIDDELFDSCKIDNIDNKEKENNEDNKLQYLLNTLLKDDIEAIGELVSDCNV